MRFESLYIVLKKVLVLIQYLAESTGCTTHRPKGMSVDTISKLSYELGPVLFHYFLKLYGPVNRNRKQVEGY